MKKFVCSVCGYVYEGEAAPEKCPQCGAPASKFTEQSGDMTWASEHVVGVAKGVSEDILEDLRANFNGECSEVGLQNKAFNDKMIHKQYQEEIHYEITPYQRR